MARLMIKKLLIALAFSIILLFAFMSWTKTIAFWHKVLFNKDMKEFEKKGYREDIILWIICTIAIFIFVFAFAKL